MIDFPNSPTVGQSFTAAGVTWVWDGVKWNVNNIAGSQFIIVSATPPTSPIIGSLWWDTIGGQLYVYYSDGTSAQWVTAINQGFGGLYLPLVGGILTGPLLLAADPTLPLGAATKEYVDALNTTLPQNYSLNSNRIINGDMRINQRGAVNGTPTTSGTYTVDRWGLGLTQPSKINWAQGSGPNSIALGFPNYTSWTCPATPYTLVATDTFYVYQPIEADMVNDFCWGTPNAQYVTLSFWAASTNAGTYSGSIRQYPAPSARAYPFTFALPGASLWTKITIVIPPDTGGSWVQGGNAAALSVAFDLGSGANFRAAAGSWQNGNLAGVTGAYNIVSNANSTFYITGVKLEIGQIATPFNRKSLSEIIADCQRYYYAPQTTWLASGYSAAATNVYHMLYFPITMRTAPTVTPSNIVYSNSSTLAFPAPDITSCRISYVGTAVGPSFVNFNASFYAEL
jgi:hypothetical protein